MPGEQSTTESGQSSGDNEQSGIVLYTEDGEPLRVCLMDENDETLRYVEELQQGVYGYENADTSVLVTLEDPR